MNARNLTPEQAATFATAEAIARMLKGRVAANDEIGKFIVITSKGNKIILIAKTMNLCTVEMISETKGKIGGFDSSPSKRAYPYILGKISEIAEKTIH